MTAGVAAAPDRDAALQASAEHWQQAQLALDVFVLAPAALGGVRIISWSSPARDAWLEAMGQLLPASAPLIAIHPQVDDGRLLGGLDLAQTVANGRVTMAAGLLAQAHGGVLLARMAERLGDAQCAALCATLDEQRVRTERDGLSAVVPAQFGCVALDEGLPGEEALTPALADRLALSIDLHPVMQAAVCHGREPLQRRGERIRAARVQLELVTTPDTLLPALCQTAWKLNIFSLRAPLWALRAARAVAALAGAARVLPEHAEIAVQLVFGPRAGTMAEPPPAEEQGGQDATPPEDSGAADNTQLNDPDDAQQADVDDLTEMLLQSAQAALPQQLLAQAAFARSRGEVIGSGGRFGPMRIAAERGVPLASRAGRPVGRARLDLLATLRRAMPWQRLRRGAEPDPVVAQGRPLIRPEDFAVRRFKQHAPTVTLFVVDASGSAAMQRLAEAKGAVEQLLAECYVRRDEVALIVFRGRSSELLLPPTRSLVRAKRALTQLAGGGGTPLASGLRRALVESQRIRRRGAVPLLVVMSDGRPNVTLEGAGDRGLAEQQARAAARAIGHAGEAAIFVDTSVRGQRLAQELSELMGGGYLPLPHVDHRALTEHLRSFNGARASAGR
ncbi:MAG: magnesium chelatase subunit D [Pseudomonadales bacterium]